MAELVDKNYELLEKLGKDLPPDLVSKNHILLDQLLNQLDPESPTEKGESSKSSNN